MTLNGLPYLMLTKWDYSHWMGRQYDEWDTMMRDVTAVETQHGTFDWKKDPSRSWAYGGHRDIRGSLLTMYLRALHELTDADRTLIAEAAERTGRIVPVASPAVTVMLHDPKRYGRFGFKRIQG